jgi:hypothetical protein
MMMFSRISICSGDVGVCLRTYSTDSHIVKSIYNLLFSINRLSRSLSY